LVPELDGIKDTALESSQAIADVVSTGKQLNVPLWTVWVLENSGYYSYMGN